MKINEIFYSLQGEGHFTGHAAVFLRFSGCNLRCDFCDTDHRSYREMSEDNIVAEMCRFPARHAVITGGEPALQLTESLVGKLHCAGFFIQVETNGSLPLPDGIDWVTCSPKSAPVQLKHFDELKVVFTAGTSLADYAPLAARAAELRLQPCYLPDADASARNLAAAIAAVKHAPQWALSFQTHRLLNIP